MSTGTKRPSSTPGPGRRTSTDPSVSPAVSGRASGTARSPTSSTSPANSITRTRSVRGGPPVSARAAMQRPSIGSSNLSTSSVSSAADEESRAETRAVLEELKERLKATEIKAEQFQKQAEVLQSRLDEALHEQGKLEDRLHESEEHLEALENAKRDAIRQKKEMEGIYEGERLAMMREREETANREEEMQTVIQRLKDSLAQRSNVDEERRMSRTSNNSSPNLDSGHFAPPAAIARSDSRNNSKILLQKDRLIESLRLELAEAQIKIVESANVGGGRLHELESLLQESRVANARLIEDNNSYQLLLSEKTLNGDFARNDFGFMSPAVNADALDALEGRTATSSLADELSGVSEGDNEDYRRMEAELKALKDQNKALTLYINKIIERLLQHQDFEAILDQSSEFNAGSPANANANVDKELPPPPPPQTQQPQASGTSILQRAKSVAMGSGRSKPRAMSQMPATHSALTDPDTAPSIPFGRGRPTRPHSDQYTRGPANVVNQMYRGQVSPPLHGPQTPRNSASFFTPPISGANPNAAARQPSGGTVPTTATLPGVKTSDSSSVESGDVTTPPSLSPPRVDKTTTFAGNKPRPLRLVQDQTEAKLEEVKRNRRTSWVGWPFNVGKKDDPSVDAIQE